MRIILGFALAFMIGAVCRIFRIPSPAPQALIGSLLVVTMSLGYITTERWLQGHKGMASLRVTQEKQNSFLTKENNHASNRV